MQLKSIASKSITQQSVRSVGGSSRAAAGSVLAQSNAKNIAHPSAYQTAIGPPTTYIHMYVHAFTLAYSTLYMLLVYISVCLLMYYSSIALTSVLHSKGDRLHWQLSGFAFAPTHCPAIAMVPAKLLGVVCLCFFFCFCWCDCENAADFVEFRVRRWRTSFIFMYCRLEKRKCKMATQIFTKGCTEKN